MFTLSSTTLKNTYSGNGSSTAFSYTFKILDEAEILVRILDADGVYTTKTLTTDYTVSNVGSASGGNVTFGTAPASTDTVILSRNMTFTQETDYVENDTFPAETHEEALDRLTMIAQQLKEITNRAVTLPYESTDANPTIPELGNQTGKFLTVNTNETGFDLVTLSSTAGLGSVVEDTSPQLGGDLDLNGHDVVKGSATIVFPSTSDTLVGKATTDTLTNKTLTSPVISTISNSGTITLPTGTDTLVGRATTDTLTNKTFDCDATGNVLTNVGSSEIKSEIISGQSSVTAATGDIVLIGDASDSNNLKKVTVDSIAALGGGGAAATQAEMEAASSTSVFVTPARQHFHPAGIKLCGKITVSSGTPTLRYNTNVASITDTAVGEVYVYFTTSFSATTSMGIVGTVETTNDRIFIVYSGSVAVGSARFDCRYSGNVTEDPAAYSFMGFGDF